MPSIISLSNISRSEFDRLKKDFHCENEKLQEHIRQYAFNHQKEGLFKTYFYVDDEDNYLGYISVSVSTIEREKINDEIDISPSIKYAIPAIKITRLCTFDGNCGKGVGTNLMYFANILATAQQKITGCRAIIVDSKHEAVEFYKLYDFTEINQEENSDTVAMVYDLLEPSELSKHVEQMISFCKYHNQKELIELLSK